MSRSVKARYKFSSLLLIFLSIEMCAFVPAVLLMKLDTFVPFSWGALISFVVIWINGMHFGGAKRIEMEIDFYV